MELRAFAEQVLLSDSLAEKIQRPATALTDNTPGEAQRVDRPVRPDNLQFAPRRTAPPMPKPQVFIDPQKRAIAHHIMANHELQALEVMAMVLLKFPAAPAEFRMGMAEIMFDEQRHTKMHSQRAEELGVVFGNLPVNSYIWNKATGYASVLEYIAGLPLVFEGANLDHTVEFEQYFLDHGDVRGAAIMKAIHKDEILHVEFGMTWLRQLKDPSLTDFQAWQQALHWPIRPAHAKGDVFQQEARRAAGMDADFIQQLRTWKDPSPKNN
ncbi:MAG TPA: DUF455 family protein [Planctomycetes bacterium]|nr:DUF455 family protein [Fuerstiella sp.]HIK90622.1 DUF455 family protein [Planctomycetota bacterium]